jgi:peptide chain release factor subunit 1
VEYAMDMRSEIRKLARIEEGEFPFFSLYLNSRWDDEQQRERIRLFTKNQLKKAHDQLKDREAWRKAAVRDHEEIEKYVDGLIRRLYEEDVNGMAIFSCSGAGIFLTYPSFIPFENEFFVDSLPVLKPLVRLSSQYQNTLAVMVDTDSARLFEISVEGILSESSIENYVPGRHDQGGPAQMRYQRHIKDHMDRHHREVAEQLATLYDSGKWKKVVLIGQDRIVANFKVFLPDRVKQHIADTFPMDFSEERFKVLKKLFERLLQKDREEIHEEIQGLKERGLKAGSAALGLNGVLEAINQGQVHTLYLLKDFSLPGGKCRHCGSLILVPSEKRGGPACPLCVGETRTIDLSEEFTKAALRQDGEVKWIDESPILKEHDGVGVSLRFRLSR